MLNISDTTILPLGHESTIRRTRMRESGVWKGGFILGIGVINNIDRNHTVYMIDRDAGQT